MKTLLILVVLGTTISLEKSYAQSSHIPLDTNYYKIINETTENGYQIEETHKKVSGQRLVIYYKEVYGKTVKYFKKVGSSIKEEMAQHDFERESQNE